MKIKVESDKIIKAVKKVEGIEIVLENTDDAKEAIDLILKKTELFKSDHYKKLKDIIVTSLQEYKTSAVDYNLIFMMEFLFEEDVEVDIKIAFIKDLQDFFSKF
jgi:copper chaperone CopZ